MKSIDVVIADDHALFRVGLRQLAEKVKGFTVIGEAHDGEALLLVLEKQRPGLLIVDHDMPGISGLDVVGRLRREAHEIRIILVTGITSEELLADYVALGVEGIVLKSEEPEVMIRAMATVRDGGQFLSSAIEPLVERANVAKVLTSRERQVLRHIAEGLSNKEISRAMGIAVKTVDNHRTNLMQKLDLHNVAELVNFAVRQGLA